jgi:hypothetical protein
MGGAGDGEAKRLRGGGLPPPWHRYQLLFRWRVQRPDRPTGAATGVALADGVANEMAALIPRTR